MKRVLITGGAGFIGFHLARRIATEPATEILLVDNLSRGKREAGLEALLSRPNVQLVCGDLTQPDVYQLLTGAFDEVYHFAAIVGVRNVIERPHEVLRINAVATLRLLEWYVQGPSRRLLFASTSEAYAWTQKFHPLPIPTPEDVPLALTDLDNPRLSYAASKMFGELLVRQFCRVHGREFVIVRFHNVYGPRMGNEHVIPELYRKAAAGQNPLPVFSASHQRAFCYVSDAVECVLRAIRDPAGAGHVFNVGNDEEEIEIGELATRILRVLKLDYSIAPQQAANDPINRRCPDIGKARRILGYAPRVSLNEGLAETLAWYAQRR
jgi:UDP-glucose 4-epimerase/UDP-glucuronate decarboxylase